MEIGITGMQTITVAEEQTAKHLGSGDLAVFGTPYMIALMENTARKSVQPHLADTQGTVGTLVNVNVLDSDKILQANEHPELFPDLVVRVTGYSAYFLSLSPELRQIVVDRVIQAM